MQSTNSESRTRSQTIPVRGSHPPFNRRQLAAWNRRAVAVGRPPVEPLEEIERRISTRAYDRGDVERWLEHPDDWVLGLLVNEGGGDAAPPPGWPEVRPLVLRAALERVRMSGLAWSPLAEDVWWTPKSERKAFDVDVDRLREELFRWVAEIATPDLLDELVPCESVEVMRAVATRARDLTDRQIESLLAEGLGAELARNRSLSLPQWRRVLPAAIAHVTTVLADWTQYGPEAGPELAAGVLTRCVGAGVVPSSTGVRALTDAYHEYLSHGWPRHSALEKALPALVRELLVRGGGVKALAALMLLTHPGERVEVLKLFALIGGSTEPEE
jgi:hypothetical protein